MIYKNNQGQAMVALLFTVSIVLFWAVETVVSQLGTVMVGNENSAGWVLETKANSYLENAALRYLRDPDYSGESLLEDGYSCTIQVNILANGKDFVSTCQKNNRFKAVGLTVTINNGLYQFSKMTER